jgi:parallel beta-helix repeat protein
MEKRILIIGLVFLLLFSSVVPISIGYKVKTPNIVVQSSNRGNTLYVGGNGPNNYTKIQDAINDAVDGDTVFVYSGTYYEHIYINKTINLIGEDKETTIINGEHGFGAIMINANTISVKGFSITGSYHGIYMNPHKVKGNLILEDNIIFDNDYGICMNGKENYVINNIITKNNYCGILLADEEIVTYCYNSTISRNNITYNNAGIALFLSAHIKIINNNISNNYNGITTGEFGSNNNNTISDNNILNNGFIGIFLKVSSNTEIFRNNLIKNGYRNAYFSSTSTTNKWDGNYWSDYRGNGLFPKIILGRRYIFNIGPLPIIIHWFNFDWHPAKEPYDIGV